MMTTQVEMIAREELGRHGLSAQGWRFEFDNAVRRLGQCRFNSRVITVSRKLAKLNEEATIRNTVLHEIAHALVGPNHGHDEVWRTKAVCIGCTGERSTAITTPGFKPVSAPWIGKCPNCGGSFPVYRLTARRRRAACRDCCEKYNGGKFDPKFIRQWRRA